MEFSEYPTVEGVSSRNVTFPELKWLTKPKFEKLIKENKLKIHPCLNEHDDLEQRIFIGKSIPQAPPLTNLGGQHINDVNQLAYNFLEITGNVFRSADKKWKLKITHNGRAYEIEDDFLVLNIQDPNSFFWSSNTDNSCLNTNYFVFNNKEVPQYAFKAAVDKIECKYTYIGRTLGECSDSCKSREKRPKFYSNAWLRIDENLSQTFGKINKAYKLLFAAYKNLEIGFDQFETLCLKASPASLKVLCRSKLRSSLNYSQSNIKSINEDRRFLIPDSLIEFLKYPSCLRVGEYMLKDEKLVHENEDYELAVDTETGNLVCRSLRDESGGDQEKSCVIAYNIDNIFLHRFHTVFYNSSNSRAITTHSIYENDLLLPYKFFIDWEKPLCQIKILA